MSRRKIKGVVFDLDGTLIHSTTDFPKMKERIIETLEANGIEPGTLSLTDTTVETLRKAEKILMEKSFSRGEIRRLLDEIDEIMNEIELEGLSRTREIEGASEVVRRIKETGHKIAILTRGHHAYAVESLRSTGMLDLFDLILGRGETPKPKPHPDALKRTAKLMGLDLDEIVFVGDHPIDSICAAKAGVGFIGVLSDQTKEGTWKMGKRGKLLKSIMELPQYIANL